MRYKEFVVNNSTIIADNTNGRLTFLIEGITGDPEAGIELSAKNEWKANFAIKTKRLARLVLEQPNAPEKSIEWARRILKI